MKNCIFCEVVKGNAKSWKVYESQSVYAFLDIHPVNEFHTLVIPKNHFENIFDLPEKEMTEVMRVVHKLAREYHDKLGINNLQIIHCSGREAQQSVFHVHFHIVPRQFGDGQDVVWKTHPEWTEHYDQLLEKLK